MGRLNIKLSKEQDNKLDRLKTLFKIKSKEDVLLKLIDKFPEKKSDDLENFDVNIKTGDLL